MNGHEGPKPSTWVRDSEATDLLERFLVAGVTTILVVRFYLALTGYPQLGGHGLHIAHLLWGGLLMLIAIVLLVTFLGRTTKHAAATIGGVGFGLFIDELGKFITSNNNYFFRPTIAIIYAIFIVLFLAFREVAQSRTRTPTWYLANALDLVQNAIIRGWTLAEQSRATLFLERSDPADPVVPALADAVAQLRIVHPRRTPFAPLLVKLRDAYFRMVQASWFPKAVIAVFVLQVISAFLELFDVGGRIGHHAHTDPTLSQWAVGISSAVAAAIALIGLATLRRSRLVAYLWFLRAVLVEILIVQFFAFLNINVANLVSLVLDLLLLIALRFMIHTELGIEARGRLQTPVDASPPVAVRTGEADRR